MGTMTCSSPVSKWRLAASRMSEAEVFPSAGTMTGIVSTPNHSIRRIRSPVWLRKERKSCATAMRERKLRFCSSVSFFLVFGATPRNSNSDLDFSGKPIHT